MYYILWQPITNYFITHYNSGSLLQIILLHITVGIINCGVITSYILTAVLSFYQMQAQKKLVPVV